MADKKATKKQLVAEGKKYLVRQRQRLNSALFSGEISQAQFNQLAYERGLTKTKPKKSGTTHKRQIARAKKNNAILWAAAEEVIQEKFGMSIQEHMNALVKKAERSKKRIPAYSRKLTRVRPVAKK